MNTESSLENIKEKETQWNVEKTKYQQELSEMRRAIVNSEQQCAKLRAQLQLTEDAEKRTVQSLQDAQQRLKSLTGSRQAELELLGKSATSTELVRGASFNKQRR